MGSCSSVNCVSSRSVSTERTYQQPKGAARCNGGIFASRLEGGRTGPRLRDPTVTLLLLPLHSFTVTLRTPFWIQASDQSLSRLLFVPCSCNFVKREKRHLHLLFVCHLVAVRFNTSSPTLPSSRLEWRHSARRWVLWMARNPLVRLQLWTRLLSRIWSRSSTSERRQTLLPSPDDSEGSATPCDFSSNLCRRAPASPPDTACGSTTALSQAVAQVAETVRGVRASTSQRVRVCDHLDPMDRLEAEPPDANQQELWRANYAKLKGGSPHDGSACTMEQFAAMHARVVTFCREPYADFARLTPYGRLVQKALCYKAPHKLADGSVTAELLLGPPAGACTASYCCLFRLQQGDPSMGRQEVVVVSSIGELPGSVVAAHPCRGPTPW